MFRDNHLDHLLLLVVPVGAVHIPASRTLARGPALVADLASRRAVERGLLVSPSPRGIVRRPLVVTHKLLLPLAIPEVEVFHEVLAPQEHLEAGLGLVVDAHEDLLALFGIGHQQPERLGVRPCEVHRVGLPHRHDRLEGHEPLEARVREAPSVVHRPVQQVRVPVVGRDSDGRDAPNFVVQVHALDHQPPVGTGARALPRVPRLHQRTARPRNPEPVLDPCVRHVDDAAFAGSLHRGWHLRIPPQALSRGIRRVSIRASKEGV
mmetsp:Transcript_3854/g.9202  ORF Transcript_3854/g.9202 Transcript_3854/m.9202 type:complete len:264 (+) Transcript_3854:654-1445(+)